MTLERDVILTSPSARSRLGARHPVRQIPGRSWSSPRRHSPPAQCPSQGHWPRGMNAGANVEDWRLVFTDKELLTYTCRLKSLQNSCWLKNVYFFRECAISFAFERFWIFWRFSSKEDQRREAQGRTARCPNGFGTWWVTQFNMTIGQGDAPVGVTNPCRKPS